MQQKALEVFAASIPHIEQQVRSKDLHAFLWGSQALGYAAPASDYDINVIHGGTLNTRWEMTHPAAAGVVYELVAIPSKHGLRGAYLNNFYFTTLVPMGEMIFSTSGKAAEKVNQFVASSDYRDALLKQPGFSWHLHMNGQGLGYFLRCVYAALVAQRTREKGVMGVGEGIPLMDIVTDWATAELRNELEHIISNREQLDKEWDKEQLQSILTQLNIQNY